MKRLWTYVKRVHISIWTLILALVVARLLLPIGAKYAINWYLENKLTSYKGHIDDFDLALYRVAYQIEGLKIWKRTKGPKEPFVDVRKIDLSLAWRALFKGKFLGDLKIDQAKLDFVDSEKKEKKQVGAEEDWKTVVGKLVPIELESLQLTNSEVHLINRDFKVPVDVVMDRIDVRAKNIKNTDDNKDLLPSTVDASARLQKSGQIEADAKINLLSRIPAFQAKAKLDELDITSLNDFFLGYGPFTFHKGRLSIYAEVSTKENRVKGYVKPFFEHLEVMGDKEHFDSTKQFFNEAGLALANLILRSSKKKTVATKIEFEGASNAPDIDKWDAFWGAMKNGFVEAMKKQLDNDISIKDVPKKN